MVFVKVRETYDLHTLKSKMSVIGIHTPGGNIVKRNYPGLLMQCKGYRPVSCDVAVACASMMPLDPLGIGTTEGDVAPEDVFNPILYKAVSNWSMSQIEQYMHTGLPNQALASVDYDNDGVTDDDFPLYYGLLSQTHEWKHANPQQGLRMSGLKPLVYETYQSIGDNGVTGAIGIQSIGNDDAPGGIIPVQTFRGRAHELPMLNTTVPQVSGSPGAVDTSSAGFGAFGVNAELSVPSPKIFCGLIIVPPSRLHQLFYRMVVEWTLEFSQIRPLGDITTWAGLQAMGNNTHWMSYDFGTSKVLTDTSEMVDTVEDMGLTKVM